MSRRTLAALKSLSDLDLELVSADATSEVDMKRVFSQSEMSVAGCMLLSVVLVDRSFALQTEDTFEAAFKPKTEAFQMLQRVLDVDTLDFCVAFSSVSGMFGNAGQTNYAR